MTGFFLSGDVVGPAAGALVVLEGFLAGCWVELFEVAGESVLFVFALFCLFGVAFSVLCANPGVARKGIRIKRTRVVKTVLMCFTINAL